MRWDPVVVEAVGTPLIGPFGSGGNRHHGQTIGGCDSDDRFAFGSSRSIVERAMWRNRPDLSGVFESIAQRWLFGNITENLPKHELGRLHRSGGGPRCRHRVPGRGTQEMGFTCSN